MEISNMSKFIELANEYIENGFMFIEDAKIIKEVHYKVIESDGVKLGIK